MKRFKDYILEELDIDPKYKDLPLERGNIKFTIWESPGKKIQHLVDNRRYQKIEYKLEDRKLDLFIDFLLGCQDDIWKLWIGKIGSCSYDDEPHCSLETKDFKEAILKALDKIEDFIKEVKKNPDNWAQYYKGYSLDNVKTDSEGGDAGGGGGDAGGDLGL